MFLKIVPKIHGSRINRPGGSGEIEYPSTENFILETQAYKIEHEGHGSIKEYQEILDSLDAFDAPFGVQDGEQAYSPGRMAILHSHFPHRTPIIVENATVYVVNDDGRTIDTHYI